MKTQILFIKQKLLIIQIKMEKRKNINEKLIEEIDKMRQKLNFIIKIQIQIII